METAVRIIGWVILIGWLVVPPGAIATHWNRRRLYWRELRNEFRK